MSTRKRGRRSLNSHDDEDELSPTKPTPPLLSTAKKRKLNTYGSKNRGENVLGKIAGMFGFGLSGKENVSTTENDELADEDHEVEFEKNEKDIWEVPDDEEVVTKTRRDPNLDRIPHIPKSARKVRKEEEEDGTPKRGRGRPPKQIESVAPPPKNSPGKPRKSDILKKAKKLSREASFQAMVDAGQRRAAEESEGGQTLTRRRSGHGHAEIEREEEVEDSTEQKEEMEPSAGPPAVPRPRGRPKKDRLEGSKGLPPGILTPTKDRTLKTKRSVAFEARDNIDLGFRDIPDTAKNSSTSKKSGKSNEPSSHEAIEEPITKVLEETEEQEGSVEDVDDIACAVCHGLSSEKGNEIIICENCEIAVHQRCYGLSKIPRGDWFCRDCQPDGDVDISGMQDNDHVALGDVFKELPEIEELGDHLRHMQRVLLDRLTGRRRIKIRGHDEELKKVQQVIEQTVLAGEGNSMLVIGARGCGKTTLVESIISDISKDHRESFHIVRLNGFIHTDDKLALTEIWRQLGLEMDAEDEMTGKANHADTLASLLALLSHPSEISESRADETAKSVVFVLDEFDLFTTHPRQTLLYNLFDIAQARKAPIVVLGLTTRIDVVETLEKRVKSRFSHRYVHLSFPRSLPAFWDICRQGLLVDPEDLESEGFNIGIPGQEEFVSFWKSTIEDLFNNDAAFKYHLQSHFYRSKSVPAFFTSCILPIANLSTQSLPLTGRKFTSGAVSLSGPDSKLHILQGLSELELALLIAAARLDIILDTDTCNFAMAYDEYSSLTSRHKIQTSSAGVTALGASAKVWRTDVALEAWERLAEYGLLIPAGIGGGSAKEFGAGGRMWKVDVGLEEIPGSGESLSAVMVKWCREI